MLLLEHFENNTEIGVGLKNKLEMNYYQLKKDSSLHVLIEFYTKAGRDWNLKSTYYLEAEDKFPSYPRVEDINGDGYLDFSYKSIRPVRGANQVRKYFIYDSINDDLIYLKNSDEYPNLAYNATLKCLDALLYYGGSAQPFLKIEGDSLVPFAWIHLGDGIKIVELDDQGNETILREDSINPLGIYERYNDYRDLNQKLNKEIGK